jgi:hypothetical protein
MEAAILETLISAGPIGVLAYILWTVFNKQAASAEKFADGVLSEMKADRETLRDEFKAMRAEHREAIVDLKTEVGGLRDDLRKLPEVA